MKDVFYIQDKMKYYKFDITGFLLVPFWTHYIKTIISVANVVETYCNDYGLKKVMFKNSEDLIVLGFGM